MRTNFLNLTFFMVTLLAPFLGNAQSNDRCGYVNLLGHNWSAAKNVLKKIKGLPPKVLNMPAYDQGRTGTCYAFAAVQLLDYWRQSRGIQVSPEIELGSPIHLALIFKLQNKKLGDLDGGFIDQAIKAISTQGFCPQKVVNESIRHNFGGENLQSLSYAQDRESTRSIINDDLVLAELTSGFISEAVGDEGGDGNVNRINPDKIEFKDFENYVKSSHRKVINGLHRDTIKWFYDNFSSFLKADQGNEFIKRMLYQCFQEKKIPSYFSYMPKVRNFSGKSTRGTNEYVYEMNGILQKLLSFNNPPAVGISYCSKVLKDRNFVGIDQKGVLSPKCGAHASVIVGMRPDPRDPQNKCQYLLKNTWNSSAVCNTWGGCETRQVKSIETGKLYNEEIGVWIDGDSLMRNVYQFTYIYPNSKSEKKQQSILVGAQKYADSFLVSLLDKSRGINSEIPKVLPIEIPEDEPRPPVVRPKNTYSWETNDDCSEWTPNGDWVSTVNDSYCGKNYYELYEEKFCREYAGSGRYIRNTTLNFCHPDRTYAWDDDLECSEYDKTNKWMRVVDDKNCGPDEYGIDENNECSKYAGSGRWKSVVADKYCQ